MPLAVMMLNRVPEVMALRGETELLVRSWNGHTVVTDVPQYNILLRALYFARRLVGQQAVAGTGLRAVHDGHRPAARLLDV